jgi:hypothetical protein
VRWLTRWRHGTVCQFEPIQTGQTHSNAIQTVLNKFKLLQTLVDPKSIFPCSKKLDKILFGRSQKDEQLFPYKLLQIQNVFLIKIWGIQCLFLTLGI